MVSEPDEDVVAQRAREAFRTGELRVSMKGWQSLPAAVTRALKSEHMHAIELEGHKLTSEEVNHLPQSLTELVLSANLLSAVPTSLKQCASSLRILKLARNRIKYLTDDSPITSCRFAPLDHIYPPDDDDDTSSLSNLTAATALLHDLCSPFNGPPYMRMLSSSVLPLHYRLHDCVLQAYSALYLVLSSRSFLFSLPFGLLLTAKAL